MNQPDFWTASRP